VVPSKWAAAVGGKAVDQIGGSTCFLRLVQDELPLALAPARLDERVECCSGSDLPIGPAEALPSPKPALCDEPDSQSNTGCSDGGSSDCLSEELEHIDWSDDEDFEYGKSVMQSSHLPSSVVLPLRQLALPHCSEQSGRSQHYGQSCRRAEAAPTTLALPKISSPQPLVEALETMRPWEASRQLASVERSGGLAPRSLLFELLEAGRSPSRGSDAVAAKQSTWLYPPRPYPEDAWAWDEAELGPGPPAQGHPAFQDYVCRALRRLKESGAQEEFEDAPLQEYQLRVAFLLHPLSPLSRLLVLHATGSGKTRSMLAAADSFFHSGKATCLFFPEEAVKENFYRELLKFPGIWRDFFCACEEVPGWRERRLRIWRPDEVAMFSPSQVEACLGLEKRVRLGEICPAFMEEWLRVNPDVPMPLAPLRAFKYTTAGGSKGGWRRNGDFDAARMDPVLKFGFDGQNPMSNKNLLFDEVHNMLAMPRWRGTYWREPLRRLRRTVMAARSSTLVFLTGSPVQKDPSDGHRLLRVLKGVEHAQAGNEGWLDAHLERPEEHYPMVLPCGVPDLPLTGGLKQELVRVVELPEEMETKYREVEGQGGDMSRLRDCCNLAVFHTWALRPQKRHLVIEGADRHAAKLHRVAMDVWASQQSALVAISRRGGLQVLKELLCLYAPSDDALIAVFSGRQSGFVSKDFPSLDLAPPSEVLRRFSDSRGSKARVLVLDTAFGREGVSIFGVEQMHLVDTPGSWAEYKQTIGRAVRFGDVRPNERRTLRVHLWAASLADESPTADEELLDQLEKEGVKLYEAERELLAMSIPVP